MAQLERGRPEILEAKQSSFGRWLKSARQRKGWSGEMLAAAVGTSQSMISAYERGFRFPRREKSVELAEALGADPREALEALMADTPGLEAIPTKEAAPDVVQLLRFYGDLSPERKVKVLEKAADLYQLTAYEAEHEKSR